jgi:(p)ppGpp synthase/HD superfamily hydrolase
VGAIADRQPLPILTDRFSEAAAYAVELHARQARKGTAIPYITHLLTVSSLVLEDGGDENQAIAALLHDGPEDQGGQSVLDEIRRRFGDDVAALVDGLSDTLLDPKPPWQGRKDAYLKRLEGEPTRVLTVSLADKVHNLRSIAIDRAAVGEAVWDRFHAGRALQEQYYRSLLAVFSRRISGSRNLPEFRRLIDDVFGPGDR